MDLLARVCARDDPLEAIIGFSGSTADEDTLLACGSTSLFVRSAGQWSEHPLPDNVAELYRLHGRSAEEVYLCTDAGSNDQVNSFTSRIKRSRNPRSDSQSRGSIIFTISP